MGVVWTMLTLELVIFKYQEYDIKPTDFKQLSAYKAKLFYKTA